MQRPVRAREEWEAPRCMGWGMDTGTMGLRFHILDLLGFNFGGISETLYLVLSPVSCVLTGLCIVLADFKIN